MKITNKERAFFKANKEVLESLFSKRIVDLQEDVFSMPSGADRDVKIEFIREFKDWLTTVKLFGKREKIIKGSDEMI